MRIGLDLDGVVANWSSTAAIWLNTRKGYSLPIEEPPYWHWLQENIKPEDWKWLWTGAINDGLFADCVVMPGAQALVRNLNQLGDVIAMTSRPRGAIRDTLTWWMDNNFRMISGWNFFDGGDDKRYVLTDVLIEDNLKYAESYYDNCASKPAVILLDRPYNQEGRGDWRKEFFVANNHNEVIELVNKVKEKRG